MGLDSPNPSLAQEGGDGVSGVLHVSRAHPGQELQPEPGGSAGAGRQSSIPELGSYRAAPHVLITDSCSLIPHVYLHALGETAF